jgi:pilus assembly protein Flp/PilA
MQRFMDTLRQFFECDDGVTAMEYALLGGLIAVVIVVAVGSVGTSLNVFFTFVADEVAAAVDNP